MVEMVKVETLIQITATIMGVITITAPVLSVLRQSRRAKGRSSGRGAGSRKWPGVLAMAVGFVGIGVLLWKPVPIQVTGRLSLALSITGAVLYFPGVSLYLWGLVTLRRQFGVSSALGAELYQDHELVTSGPYAVIRHPMYLGVLLAAIGALLIFKTWAMVVFAPMSTVVISRAQREEKLLAETFGDEWQTYSESVARWFPGL